ncbi:MAG: helix-turn-helix transcriptional regulator, partial [Bacteroidetes bacterium]|nr:helix-turn-helix transcriptional regulator [Bacteroidota bacterium]
MEIGVKVKKIRELRNYSQEYMSERIGISQEAYSRLETGKTKLDLHRMLNIANILEIDPILLLSFDEGIVFNNCSQSGKNVTNNNGLSEEKQANLEERL